MCYFMIGVAIVAAYGFSSLLFLKKPHLLHKKKPSRFRCVHISHRGGAGENLENTLTAFKHAEQVGTDMLELDCQLTADGVVVIAHDNNLKRLCGIDKNISDIQFNSLPLLLDKLPLDFDAFWVTSSKNDDRQIITLKQVFEQFPNMPINVDIKVEDPMLCSKVSDLVKQYDRASLTVWGNFKNDTCLRCYKENSSIAMLFSLKRVVWLTVFFWTGLLPFIPLKEQFLEIIWPQLFLDNDRPAPFTPSRFQRIILRAVDLFLVRPALFKHLELRGIQTYIWVLNREQDFDAAFKRGASGVMTDFPSLLSDYLNKNPDIKAKMYRPPSSVPILRNGLLKHSTTATGDD